MFETMFAGAEKHLGRIGMPLVSAAVGAGAGAAAAHFMEKSLPVGAAIGAVAGGVGAEAGRALFTDKKLLVELQTKNLEEQKAALLAELTKLEAEADKAKAKK